MTTTHPVAPLDPWPLPPSIEELAGGLVMGGFAGLEPPPALLRLVRERHLGGIILFKRNYRSPEQVRALIDEVRAAAPDPAGLLAAVDQEGGPVIRFGEPFTRLPAMARLGEVGDPLLAAEVGRLLAVELREVGINLDLAPVLDVLTREDNPAIGRRAFGREPAQVAALGAAFIRGMQAEGVGACAKHFPGHGDAGVDSHHLLPVLEHLRPRLDAIELPPFVEACRIPVASVMIGHLRLPALDPDHPASLSRAIIQGLLREQLGYDGVVITDDLEMAPILDRLGVATTVTQGLAAGIDLFLVCHRADRQEQLLDALLEEVHQGRVDRTRLEQSWRRLARLRQQYPPRTAPLDPTQLGHPRHQAVAARLQS